MPRAKPLDVGALGRDLTRWEGESAHMYRDSHGLVTAGIGHLLKTTDDAVALPWIHQSTGRPASPQEVRAAFSHVAGMAPGCKADFYAAGTELRLTTETVRALATDRLEREFLPGIRRLCPHFDGYPAPAQRALVDMAYNLGTAGLGKFRQLTAACERGDFAAAAMECHRKTCRPERNQFTHDLFLEAANLNLSVRTRLGELRP